MSTSRTYSEAEQVRALRQADAEVREWNLSVSAEIHTRIVGALARRDLRLLNKPTIASQHPDFPVGLHTPDRKDTYLLFLQREHAQRTRALAECQRTLAEVYRVIRASMKPK